MAPLLLAPNMTTSVIAITDINQLTDVESELSDFLNKYCQNPFLLLPFIKTSMSRKQKNTIPFLLVLKENGKIVGFAPLRLKQRFGFRSIDSLLKPAGSPDIVAVPEKRQRVISEILHFLLREYRCASIALILPAESANLQVLEQECKKEKVILSQLCDEMNNHYIIKVDRSWANYQKSLSRKYRATITNTERQLTKLGKWQVQIDQINEDRQTVENTIAKIHQIEAESWKEEWRLQNRQTFDQDLEGIWKTAYQLVRVNPSFKTYVWILQLEDKPVAYALVICYKKTAIMAKTSYSKKIAKASPGIYIMNAAVSGLFTNSKIQTIDFLTALPFVQKWHPILLSRIKLQILPKKLAIFRFITMKLIEEMPIGKLSPVKWFLKGW